ncbi:MAG: hypothetical protein ACK5BN_03275, partial [Planctomycetota bacterium]
MRSHRRSCALSVAVAAACFAAGVRAQAEAATPNAQSPLVARAIREWTAAFEQGRLGARAVLQAGDDRQPAYVAPARAAGYVTAGDATRITHGEARQTLTCPAERWPDAELGAALLGIAAVGLEGVFLDRDAIELRERGHDALLRSEDARVWSVVLRAAAGERLVLGSQGGVDGRADAAVVPGPARRVAALRLLGARNRPAYRSTVEGALLDPDPRVRLGAAEAVAGPWRAETLRSVQTALAGERHPVVSQALVRLVLAIRRAPPAEVGPEALDDLAMAAVERFGRCGWRTDMDLLDLVVSYPRKAQVPVLLRGLDAATRAPDRLLGAANERASPLLRERLCELLRAMTGAIVADDDPQGWRDFWAREQDRVMVPDPLPLQRGEATKAQFFGVPVAGGAVAFLLDTRGSMGDDLDDAAEVARRRTAARARRGERRRVRAAVAAAARRRHDGRVPAAAPAEPPTPLRSWLGFAAFYAAAFAVLAVYMQFFPAWLHGAGGLKEAEVSVVMAAQTVARTLLGTYWAHRVDRRGDARPILLGHAAARVGAFALFGGAPGLVGVAVV